LDVEIPEPYSLIYCVTGATDDLMGRSGVLSYTRIRQHDKALAAEVPSGLCPLLTVKQFIAQNTSKKNPKTSRIPIPGYPNASKDADLVMGPITNAEATNVNLTEVGDAISAHNLRRITITAGCTEEAWDYLKSHCTKIVILGFGEGKMGFEHSVTDFGSAGIIRGASGYKW